MMYHHAGQKPTEQTLVFLLVQSLGTGVDIVRDSKGHAGAKDKDNLLSGLIPVRKYGSLLIKHFE